MSYKICPLLAMSHNTPDPIHEDYLKCLEFNCQWFVTTKDEYGCAVTLLTHILAALAKQYVDRSIRR